MACDAKAEWKTALSRGAGANQLGQQNERAAVEQQGEKQRRRAVLVLVASSFNTGLAVMPKPGGGFDVNWGRQPVLVTRVGAKVTAVGIAGMRYRMIDFNERVLGEGTVGANGVLRSPLTSLCG